MCVPVTYVGREVRHGDLLSNGCHQLLSQHGLHVVPEPGHGRWRFQAPECHVTRWSGGKVGFQWMYVGDLQVLSGPPLGLYVGRTAFGAVRWRPAGLMVAEPAFGAVCWQPIGLMWLLDRLYVVKQVLWGLLDSFWMPYVGTLQVLWGLLGRLWGYMLATYRLLDCHWGCMLATYGSYQGLLVRLWSCMLATYRSYERCWTAFGATYRSYPGCWTTFGPVCWHPAGLIRGCWTYVGNLQVLSGVAGPPLGLYVGNLRVLFIGDCWTAFGAVCWQPTVLIRGCWTAFGAVCWQPTCLIGDCWTAFGAVCWQPTGPMGLLDSLQGCMLATYRSYGVAGPPLGVYVGELQALWALLDRLWGCMLATYRSYGGCCIAFGAVCWQPTGGCWTAFGAVCCQHTGRIGAPLGLYVGNLQDLWELLDWLWGCMLRPTRLIRGCWTAFGCMLATYRSSWGLLPTGLIGVAGPPLGLSMLGTYKSYGVGWLILIIYLYYSIILHVYIVCYMCVLIIEIMKLRKEYKSIKTGHVCRISAKQKL